MAVDPGVHLETERVRLRPWCDADIEPFSAFNADAEAMRYFPWTYNRAESEASMDRFRAHFAEHGWGPWVVEVPGETSFAGVVGLSTIQFEAHFTPAVELGLRIQPALQGRGFATEAARASVAFGFQRAGLKEIVAMCTPDNRASRRVMEKLGMTRDPADDFDHPAVGASHPMRRVVLYRLRADNWHGGTEPLFTIS